MKKKKLDDKKKRKLSDEKVTVGTYFSLRSQKSLTEEIAIIANTGYH